MNQKHPNGARFGINDFAGNSVQNTIWPILTATTDLSEEEFRAAYLMKNKEAVHNPFNPSEVRPVPLTADEPQKIDW